MKRILPPNSAPPEDARRHSRWQWLLGGAGLLVMVVGVLLPREEISSTGNPVSKEVPRPAEPVRSRSSIQPRMPQPPSTLETARSAEEIVASKLSEFARKRRALVHDMARHFKVEVPGDVERFFAAVEGGRWEEADAIFKSLRESDENSASARSEEFHRIWRPIQETWGIARETRNWPAQKLLDYGQAVLGSLRPGMVYIGGTDPGCFIPTFLNETSEGERHIVISSRKTRRSAPSWMRRARLFSLLNRNGNLHPANLEALWLKSPLGMAAKRRKRRKRKTAGGIETVLICHPSRECGGAKVLKEILCAFCTSLWRVQLRS